MGPMGAMGGMGPKGKGGPAKGAMAMATPCRFGAKCTRPGCFFVHPPGFKVPTKGEGKGGKAGTPCRNGADCKRPDCYFAHPAVCLPVMGGEATEEKKEEEAA